MGHKFSTVHGVKSNNFYESGNAINEIWLGNLEIISRLPFGDSDIRQAGWPQGTWPKIPWHQFIIPLKRDIHPVACDGPACHPAPSMQTSLALRRRVVSFYVASLLVLLMILIRLLVKLSLRWNRVVPIHLDNRQKPVSHTCAL
ncbi:hypothetical protein PDE_02879 [Penicillium oxalicum 114-2]|uniref:Uncharacterized protein n=1 Tax=Penicillium oxalicum (strain 114-2 / CGMCC 5302) TaxID=933388 RepID=S7ZBH9_PENO1|nr:hypothetical protein PDE_02879 [Penicillium oxalicum 114-2]